MKKRFLKLLTCMLSLCVIGASVSLLPVSAASTNIATDASKWAQTSNVTIDSNGAHATGANFSMISNTLGGNTDANICVNLYGTGGSWGYMAVVFKFDSASETASFAYSEAVSSGIVLDGTKGVNVAGTGHWIAFVAIHAGSPKIIEFQNGTIVDHGGFPGANGYDTWHLFTQTTFINFAISDNDSGVSIAVSFDAQNTGCETDNAESSKSISSTNTALRGNSGIAIMAAANGATLNTGNNTITVDVEEQSSSYDVLPATPVEFGNDSTKWISKNAVANGTDAAYATSPMYDATTIEVDGNSIIDLQFNFINVASTEWYRKLILVKWNEGVDSVTWNLGAGDSFIARDLYASNAKGNWVGLFVDNVGSPVLFECINGVISTLGEIGGLNGYDFWHFYGQDTNIIITTSDTQDGCNISASFEVTNAYPGHAVNGKKIISAKSTNTALHGKGSIRIAAPWNGAGAMDASNNAIYVKVTQNGTEKFIKSEQVVGLKSVYKVGEAIDKSNASWVITYTDGTQDVVPDTQMVVGDGGIAQAGATYVLITQGSGLGTSWMHYPITVVDIAMEANVAVKLASTIEKSGLRYKVTLSSSVVDALVEKGYTVELGIAIAPAEYETTIGALNEENIFGENAIYAWREAGSESYERPEGKTTIMNMYDTVLKVDDANAENKCLVASIVNIKEANYSREFKGVGYVKLTLGETVTYIFADNNNNVASISARATEYLANSEIVSALAPEQIAILNTYAGVVAE